MSDAKAVLLEKLVQAAIEVRTERNWCEDAVGGGEIQWAEAMTEPVDKLILALNLYQMSGLPMFKAESTVDKDIKTGLWQKQLDGEFIKVRSVGLTVIQYSNEGFDSVYSMGVSALLDDYCLYEADQPAVDDKKSQEAIREQGRAFIAEQAKNLPEHLKQRVLDGLDDTSNDDRQNKNLATLEGYLSSLKPDVRADIDDTFNGGTPEQTFGGIEWDKGTDEKCEAILVKVCPKCGSTVPADSGYDPVLSRWAAKFLKAWKASEVGE